MDNISMHTMGEPRPDGDARRGFPLPLALLLSEVVRMRIRADAAVRDAAIVARGLASMQKQIEAMIAREARGPDAVLPGAGDDGGRSS
jgi:hypothetical protein